MSTIADQAVSRAVTRGLVIIDRYGHNVESGYVIEGPSGAEMEWTVPGVNSTATVARLLGGLTRPRDVLVVESLDPHTVIVEQCQRVATEREAHHLTRLRGATHLHDVKRGQLIPAAQTAWIVRTPATAIARELLGASKWTYLADPVGSHRPGETLQTGTAHAYHTRETAERAIKNARARGRSHAEHAEPEKVNL